MCFRTTAIRPDATSPSVLARVTSLMNIGQEIRPPSCVRPWFWAKA